MTSLTVTGFGTHHLILMKIDPHFSRQLLEFQRKLKSQIECLENGCNQKHKTMSRYLLRY